MIQRAATAVKSERDAMSVGTVLGSELFQIILVLITAKIYDQYRHRDLFPQIPSSETVRFKYGLCMIFFKYRGDPRHQGAHRHGCLSSTSGWASQPPGRILPQRDMRLTVRRQSSSGSCSNRREVRQWSRFLLPFFNPRRLQCTSRPSHRPHQCTTHQRRHRGLLCTT